MNFLNLKSLGVMHVLEMGVTETEGSLDPSLLDKFLASKGLSPKNSWQCLRNSTQGCLLAYTYTCIVLPDIRLSSGVLNYKIPRGSRNCLTMSDLPCKMSFGPRVVAPTEVLTQRTEQQHRSFSCSVFYLVSFDMYSCVNCKHVNQNLICSQWHYLFILYK